MKKTRIWLLGIALLVSIAMPVAVMAAEDIPPMDRLAIPDLAPTPEERLVLRQEEPLAANTDIIQYRSNDGESPQAEGESIHKIENSPALRVTANENATADYTERLEETPVPLADQPNTGYLNAWMPILGSILILGAAVPVLVQKKSR